MAPIMYSDCSGNLANSSLRIRSHPVERVFEPHQPAGLSGKLLGHEERLRKESFQAARALHRVPVFARKLFQAEHRDDVLQLLIARQRLADLLRDAVVPRADDLRRDHLRSGLAADRSPDRVPRSRACATAQSMPKDDRRCEPPPDR